MPNILIIVGSLAQQSFNRKVAEFIAAKYASQFQFTFAQIDDLPLYTQDRDANSPASYQRLRAQIKQADGVLIVSPEHNRSIPAALKNAIDIASRPAGEGVWSGKPIAIITATPRHDRRNGRQPRHSPMFRGNQRLGDARARSVLRRNPAIV